MNNEEIIEKVLKEYENKKGWMVFYDHKIMLEMDVEFCLKEALAMKDEELENKKTEHENQVKAIIDVNEQKINQIKAEELEFLKGLKDYLKLPTTMESQINKEISRRESEGKEKIK